MGVADDAIPGQMADEYYEVARQIIHRDYDTIPVDHDGAHRRIRQSLIDEFGMAAVKRVEVIWPERDGHRIFLTLQAGDREVKLKF